MTETKIIALAFWAIVWGALPLAIVLAGRRKAARLAKAAE